MVLKDRGDIEEALNRVGELLAAEGYEYADLVFFKLFASVDSGGPKSVHYQDLIVLRPSPGELLDAAAWVETQDASPEFPGMLKRVVDHAQKDLEPE